MATASKNRVSDWDTTRQKLAQTRDELKLKMHLAKADARDEWTELEEKWHHVERRLKGIRQESSGAAKTIWDDLKGVVDDLQAGYERIRRAL